MILQDVIDAIKEIKNEINIEKRNQKLDYLLNNVPFDKSRIEEIIQDIEELTLEAHNLDSKISVRIIEDIIRKYKI